MRITTALTIAGAFLIFASPAMARSVACPSGPLHAEIIDPPVGWSPVQDSGAFSAARVEGAGANLALICEYGEAGRITSQPPPGERVCRVSGTGFDCRRPVNTDELGPPVGTLQLVEGDTVDLDVAPPLKSIKFSLTTKSTSLTKSIDFIFANFVNTRDQPGYDLESSSRASPFVRRFPQPNECPLGGTTSTGVYFPLIDPNTRTTQTGPMFACVTTSSGKWYLTQLTKISRSDNKTRATLTWWRF